MEKKNSSYFPFTTVFYSVHLTVHLCHLCLSLGVFQNTVFKCCIKVPKKPLLICIKLR